MSEGSAFGKVVSEAIGKMDDIMTNASKGKTMAGKDQAINRLGRNMTGGLEYISRITHGGEGFADAAKSTFAHTNAAGEVSGYNWGKIAASYVGVAGAGRVMGGGGVYKDGAGNTNLVGVPFV